MISLKKHEVVALSPRSKSSAAPPRHAKITYFVKMGCPGIKLGSSPLLPFSWDRGVEQAFEALGVLVFYY